MSLSAKYLSCLARGRLESLSGLPVSQYVSDRSSRSSAVLLTNGLFDIRFAYQDHEAALAQSQREQAEAAAFKIGEFIKQIRDEIGWTTLLPWSGNTIDQRRLDALRLLRQVPAITDVVQLDPAGRERLHVSRIAMDVVGSGADFSHDPRFIQAIAKQVYYGDVYFRRESEPYMTLAVAGIGSDTGVSVAEVNLKLIWDVVSQIKVGESGQVYVVDAEGRLIAHPDLSLVLGSTDMTRLTQVEAARAAAATGTADRVQVAKDIRGREVLTTYAPVAALDWLVFVELPTDEAYAPIYQAVRRSGALLLAGTTLAFLCGLFLARRSFRSRPCAGAPHRRRRPDSAHRDQDRRRLEALADVQPHDRQLQDPRKPRAQGRRTHPPARTRQPRKIALAAASHDLRSPAGNRPVGRNCAAS